MLSITRNPQGGGTPTIFLLFEADVTGAEALELLLTLDSAHRECYGTGLYVVLVDGPVPVCDLTPERALECAHSTHALAQGNHPGPRRGTPSPN